MNPAAPLNLQLFVIGLGILVQFVAGLLGSQTDNLLAACAIGLLSLVVTLAYAVQISYRRGYQAANSRNSRTNHV